MMQSRHTRVRTVLRARVAGMLLAMALGLWGAIAPRAATAGHFINTGALATARGYHTATLLPSGQVLIAGGYNGISLYLASAELYDSATGRFSSTGALATARAYHTATLLPSGQVLVAGGETCDHNSCTFLASAELYDPATGRFSPTGAMMVARSFHTATPLSSGQVLVTGGYGDGTRSAELYDPATGLFHATEAMTWYRAHHTATLLPSGQVLVAGGYGEKFFSPAELYDPATELFSDTGRMIGNRNYHTATLLYSGQVLVTGGRYDGVPLVSAELYDPATGQFSATGWMTESRMEPTATLLRSRQVLVAGGRNSTRALASAELYDPVAGRFSTTGAMATARYAHTATFFPIPRRPGWQVLVAGGYNDTSGYLASAELYTPLPSSLANPSTAVAQSTSSGSTLGGLFE